MLFRSKGVPEIYALVKCTDDSREPGRIYSVNYNFSGEMMGCETEN